MGKSRKGQRDMGIAFYPPPKKDAQHWHDCVVGNKLRMLQKKKLVIQESGIGTILDWL